MFKRPYNLFLPPFLGAVFFSTILGCGSQAPLTPTEGGVDSGPDADVDTDVDADSDSDTDTDSDTDGDSDNDTETVTDTETESDTCEEIECGEPYVRFVNGAAGSPGDGLSWESAFNRVQDGIDSAGEAFECCQQAHQVWVAAGTYYIYESSPDDTVLLRPGVALLGGFEGDETSAEERDFFNNKTVLDGANGPEGEAFARHVVAGGDGSEIDGFTITRGRASGDEDMDKAGGGMFIIDVEMTVRNCFFEDNLAGGDSAEEIGSGGGIYIEGGHVIVEDSIFLQNVAFYGGGLFATGEENSTEVTGCRFLENTADYDEDGSGGAIANFSKQLAVRNTLFYGNMATRVGGAFYENGKSTISNCTFTGNGTIWLWGGGALHVTSVNTPLISNSIIWDNYPEEVHVDVFSFADIRYSDVRGGFDGDGNLDSDPHFADQIKGLFELSSGSPCVDAADGDAALDYDIERNTRVDDPSTPNTGVGSPDYVDMGAFELQVAELRDS